MGVADTTTVVLVSCWWDRLLRNRKTDIFQLRQVFFGLYQTWITVALGLISMIGRFMVMPFRRWVFDCSYDLLK